MLLLQPSEYNTKQLDPQTMHKYQVKLVFLCLSDRNQTFFLLKGFKGHCERVSDRLKALTFNVVCNPSCVRSCCTNTAGRTINTQNSTFNSQNVLKLLKKCYSSLLLFTISAFLFGVTCHLRPWFDHTFSFLCISSSCASLST